MDRNTSTYTHTHTQMINAGRHFACVDVSPHTRTDTHPRTHNPLHPFHLAGMGPDHVSVGAYWQTEGVGRQIHGEGEPGREKRGK